MARDEMQITLSKDEIEKFKLLEEAKSFTLPSNKPLIQMVPQVLCSCYGKEDFERYFKPTSVAIGPINHQRKTDKDSRTERGEECKLKLAAMLIKSSEGRTEDFYKNVKKEINSLRNCYDSKEVQEWTDEDLAWMFLVDGCALLGFISLDGNDEWEEFIVDNDVVRIERVDFFLLENQLPYKLLKILTDSLAESSGITEINLTELSKKFITKFSNGCFLSPTAQQQHQIQVDYSRFHHPHEQQQQEEDPPHLLDLLRRRLMGVKSKEKGEKQKQIYKGRWWKTQPGDESERWPSIRNVKELKGKGIRFKAREKGGAITDIDFNDHCCMPTITLAPIFLHNTTMPLLLNLMAYELCPDFKEDCVITSHLSFLSSLIDNCEDAKELRVSGVLHNGLGCDEAVAELFNKISGILVPFLKIELRHDIDQYCNSNKSHLMEAIHTYFRSTWSFLVFLSTLAGLIMQGMQTYCGIRKYKLH